MTYSINQNGVFNGNNIGEYMITVTDNYSGKLCNLYIELRYEINQGGVFTAKDYGNYVVSVAESNKGASCNQVIELNYGINSDGVFAGKEYGEYSVSMRDKYTGVIINTLVSIIPLKDVFFPFPEPYIFINRNNLEIGLTIMDMIEMDKVIFEKTENHINWQEILPAIKIWGDLNESYWQTTMDRRTLSGDFSFRVKVIRGKQIFYSGERGFSFGVLNSKPMMYNTKAYGSAAYRQGIDLPANQRVKVSVQPYYDVTPVKSVKKRVNAFYDVTPVLSVKRAVRAQYDAVSPRKVKLSIQAYYDVIMPDAPTPYEPPEQTTDFREQSTTGIPDFVEVG